MTQKTFVIGVGHDEVRQAGHQGGRLPGLGAGGGREGARGRGDRATSSSSRRSRATCTATRRYGQRAVYELGLTGIPVVNVNNNCSTGSSALLLARQAVKGGLVDCALAIGFEKMERGLARG